MIQKEIRLWLQNPSVQQTAILHANLQSVEGEHFPIMTDLVTALLKEFVRNGRQPLQGISAAELELETGKLLRILADICSACANARLESTERDYLPTRN